MLDELIDRLAAHNVLIADLAISQEPGDDRSTVACVISIPSGMKPGKIQEEMLVALLLHIENPN